MGRHHEELLRGRGPGRSFRPTASLSPNVLSTIGNANSNVGGRTINFGQQSVNVRGVGLLKDTKDIGNIVLSQSNGIPILLKDIANIYVGSQPRMGIAGRDAEDDVVMAIVVMNRTKQTNEMVNLVKAEIEKINTDGTLPPGVKAVPFYDPLDARRRHDAHRAAQPGLRLHPGVFLIQWIFLGDLRKAIIVGMNILFALFFSIIILVATGQSANLLSVGAVDFEDHRRCVRDPDRKHLPQLPAKAGGPGGDLGSLLQDANRRGIARLDRPPARIIFASAMQVVDRAIPVLHDHHGHRVHPALHHAGRRRVIFNPMARGPTASPFSAR